MKRHIFNIHTSGGLVRVFDEAGADCKLLITLEGGVDLRLLQVADVHVTNMECWVNENTSDGWME